MTDKNINNNAIDNAEHKENILSDISTYGLGRLPFFVLLAFLTGTTIAVYIPVMSLYLKSIVHATDTQVGFYYVIVAIVGVVLTQFIAYLSDVKFSRRALIKLSAVCGIIASILLVYFPNYWVIITLGVIFLSISGIAEAQIFAAGREYSIYKYNNSIMFTTYMRVFFSLSWVVAPPFGYFIYNHCGYEVLFILSMIIFAIYGIVSHYYLPNTNKDTKLKNSNMNIAGFTKEENKEASTEESNENSSEYSKQESKTEADSTQISASNQTDNVCYQQSRESLEKNENLKFKNNLLNKLFHNNSFTLLFNRSVIFLFIAFSLLWTCNYLYLISMPLYLNLELKINSDLPGFMMSTVAMLEMPVAIVAGIFAQKLGIKPLVCLSVVAAFLFYLLFLFLPTDKVLWYILIQFFNALFIGIFASLGMQYLQELLPSIPGQATTLFNNSCNIGSVLSGIIIVFMANFPALSNGSYAFSFKISIVMSIVAFIMILAAKKV